MNKSTTYVVKIKICGEDRYFLSDRVIGGLVLNKEEAFHFGKLENAEKKRDRLINLYESETKIIKVIWEEEDK